MRVRECDVLIVGGGIAGVAIAERLAREAHRQGKEIDIVLIEREKQLAMHASSGLEGWYHTGSLYTKIDDGHSFTTCLKSLEDMTNWYAQDELFMHSRSCSIEYEHGAGIRVVTSHKMDQSTPGSSRTTTHKWFEQGINFVVQSDDVSQEWVQTEMLIRDRMTQVYSSQSWVNQNSQACQMPPLDLSVPDLNSGHVSAKDQRCFRDGVQMSSGDVTMDTSLILRHLSESATRFGVEFLVNHSALLTAQTEENERVLIVRSSETNEHIEFRMTQAIYAIGDQSYAVLDEDRRVKRIQSVMITRQPAISSQNTVVLNEDHTRDINHICHLTTDGGYSILADSNSIKLDPSQSEASKESKNEAAQAIFEKSKAFFGDIVGEFSDWSMISCIKTEVQSENESSRAYSYWWGPEYAAWTHTDWVNQRARSQFETQESIRDSVCQMKIEITPSISADSWALKKAIHFSVLGLSRTHCETNARKFRSIQQLASKAANERADHSRQSPIFIIPGKFSLFPSVAHNIYLECEMRGLFLNLEPGLAIPRELSANSIAEPQACRVFAQFR